MSDTNQRAAAAADPTLVTLDPGTLVIGENVRLDPALDKSLIASIRERGVIEPIIAHTNTEGRVVVIAGQRRTLASIEAGRATVPVVLVSTPQEADRIVDQMAENEHRDPLTQADRVAAIQQLSLIGLTAAQVAKRTATKRATIEAALSVAKSKIAKQAIEAHTDLTLEQGAALADLDDDPEAVAYVLEAIEDSDSIPFALQRAREERDMRRAVAALTAQAEADGLRVIETHWSDESVKNVRALTDAQGGTLDPDAHRHCPGHAVSVTPTHKRVSDHECTKDCPQDCTEAQTSPMHSVRDYILTPACQDWQRQGHRDRFAGNKLPQRKKVADMSQDERAEAKSQHAQVIRLNKDWKTAQAVRLDWLKTFAARKTPPKAAATFTARMIANHPSTLNHRDAASMAAEILGIEAHAWSAHAGIAKQIEQASDKHVVIIALVFALAACEAQSDRFDWRQTNSTTALYLCALAGWGYSLVEVEERAAGLWSKDATESH